MSIEIKSRQRVIDHGEVFTPPGLVSDMLDLVQSECERIDSRFLEPACGTGNFLVEVFRRKLVTVTQRSAKNRQKWERDAILAISSLYGIDLLADNVLACRERLLDHAAATHVDRFKEPLPPEARESATYILSRNIVQGDALTLKTTEGSPIVFSEWSPINGTMLKRRDFAYNHLLEQAHTSALPLFSDLGHDVYLPTPVADHAACHYLKVAEAEVAR